MRNNGRPAPSLLSVFLSLTALFPFLPPPASAAGHAVVLQYHHFGDDTPPSTSVSVDRFREHLDYIGDNGYVVWPLERIVDALEKGESVPERCVAITIDDAYRSVYERAFPLLRKRGLPFTVFVPTEGVDGGYGSYMSWDQMRLMQRHGASFASHSAGHDFLVRRHPDESERLWARRVREDIIRSRRRIEEELGTSSRLFAYPYGEYSAPLRDIVRDLDLVAFAQHSGPVWAGSDFLALTRFPMAGAYAAMEQFRLKVGSRPLPVVAADPADPVLSARERRPSLRLRVAEGDYSKTGIACYSGGRPIPARWVPGGENLLEVRAREPLPAGRSSYVCTAPHRKEKSYFWYSHLWIRGSGP